MATKKTTKKTSKKTTKEYRGSKLLNILHKTIPGVGMVKADEHSDRRVFFTFRGKDFLLSSRLIVTECGFGRNVAYGRNENEVSKSLTARLKETANKI